MADNAISGEEQELLYAEFIKAETSMAPGGSVSNYITEVEELAKIYLIV